MFSHCFALSRCSVNKQSLLWMRLLLARRLFNHIYQPKDTVWFLSLYYQLLFWAVEMLTMHCLLKHNDKERPLWMTWMASATWCARDSGHTCSCKVLPRVPAPLDSSFYSASLLIWLVYITFSPHCLITVIYITIIIGYEIFFEFIRLDLILKVLLRWYHILEYITAYLFETTE